MAFEIKDDLIYSDYLNSWVFIEDYLLMIVNDAAETMKSSATLKFVKSSDSEGNHWKYPTIKVSNSHQAELVCQSLLDQGIPAQVDLYEDDDGYPGQLKKIWSVTIPDMIFKDIDLPYFVDDTVYKWDSETMSYVTG